MNYDHLKRLVPYLPLIIVAFFLYFYPYFIFPENGDTFYHLVRAREILESPFVGLFWDNLVYYPLGRAIWHPPLFHSIFAFLWYIGGVRFAHSIFCITQILLTIGIASWFANKYYGPIAGLFAGILVLASPRADIIPVIMPAAYIPILVVLTIHFLPKNKINAFITSLIGIWTHMIGLIIFLPLFLIQDIKNRENLKMVLLLLPSIIFWAFYWIYFKNQTGAYNHVQLSLQMPYYTNYFGLLILSIMGIVGLYYLYKVNKEQFNLFIFYIITITSAQFIFADISRGFHYVTLPIAILSGLTIQKVHNYLSKCSINIRYVFILILLLISALGTLPFFNYVDQASTSWSQISTPFEGEYNPLTEYLEKNTDKNEVIWASSSITDLLAWTTGRKISNGRLWGGGPPKNFVELKQRINIYVSNDTMIIKNSNNVSVREI